MSETGDQAEVKPKRRRARKKVQTHVRAFGRSLSDFEPLLPAEQKLLEATARGEVAVIGDKRPEEATEENTVRAEFLRFLLLGGDEVVAVHERGVRLCGAWIAGTLDLENSTRVSAVWCAACAFSDTIVLRRSKLLNGVFLPGCSTLGIRADGATIKGGVLLIDDFKSNGEVRFLGAKIDGNLECSGAHLDGNGSDALSVDGIMIKGSVILGNGFKAVGGVRLLGAQIDGNIECERSLFDGKGDYALAADNAVIKGAAFFRDDFIASGTVRLPFAQLGSILDFRNAQLNGQKSDALFADGVIVKGNVFLLNGFRAVGEVRLPGARIDGDLNCSDAQIEGHKSDALSADSAVIKGSVFLRGDFKAIGTVRLPGVQIGGTLDCTHAQLEGRDRYTLIAQSMHVTDGFIFRDLVSPASKVDISAAYVGVLVDDISTWGSDLILDGFTYSSIAGAAPTNAADRLAWLDKQQSKMSGLSGTGVDFRPQPWKQLQKVLREMGHAEDARQVAIALEDRLRKANLIGVTPPHWDRPRKTIYRHVARIFHWGFRALTGYGYRPMRLMVWMLAVWLGSAAFYWFTALTQPYVFAPSNPLVFQHPQYQVCAPETPESKAELAKPPNKRSVVGAGNWYLCEKLRGEYTGFSPLAYSMDVLLPLVDLQQQKDWGPIIPTPKSSWWRELLAPSWGHAARLVIWFQTLFGWVASLLLVAIVSGLTKRRED